MKRRWLLSWNRVENNVIHTCKNGNVIHVEQGQKTTVDNPSMAILYYMVLLKLHVKEELSILPQHQMKHLQKEFRMDPCYAYGCM